MNGERRPYLVWILVGSLMLNALLAGLFIGRAAQPPSPSLPERGRLMSQLSPEDRRLLGRFIGEARRDAGAEIRAHRQARRAARQALLAEPYDAEAVQAAFERERIANAAVAAKIQNALTERLGDLSPEDRARLAEFALSGREPRPRRPRR